MRECRFRLVIARSNVTARIFGDQQDPKSEIAKLLASEKTFRLMEEKGTKPNVFYINKYSPRA